MYFYTFLKPFVQYKNKLKAFFIKIIKNLRTTRNPNIPNRSERRKSVRLDLKRFKMNLEHIQTGIESFSVGMIQDNMQIIIIRILFLHTNLFLDRERVTLLFLEI